jgi:hypothetical protein
MNTHSIRPSDVTEELLIARFWQLEMSSEQIAQLDGLIATDALLLARWQKLCADMTALTPQAAPTLAPFTLRRLQQRLKLHAEPSAARQWPKFVATFAAGTAAVSLWISIPRTPTGSAPIAPQVVDTTKVPDFSLPTRESRPGVTFQPKESRPAQNASSLRAVSLHLREAHELVVAYDAADGAQQKLLADVIAQNQRCQLHARTLGQNELARVLGALEPVLIALQDADERDDTRGLVEQFEFESHAVLTKLRGHASKFAPKTI